MHEVRKVWRREDRQLSKTTCKKMLGLALLIRLISLCRISSDNLVLVLVSSDMVHPSPQPIF